MLPRSNRGGGGGRDGVAAGEVEVEVKVSLQIRIERRTDNGADPLPMPVADPLPVLRATHESLFPLWLSQVFPRCLFALPFVRWRCAVIAVRLSC